MEFKGRRGVWGASLMEIFDFNALYVFLHHFLSICLIFNNFFSCFPLFFVSFGSLPPPPWGELWHIRGWLQPPLATSLHFSINLHVSEWKSLLGKKNFLGTCACNNIIDPKTLRVSKLNIIILERDYLWHITTHWISCSATHSAVQGAPLEDLNQPPFSELT